MAITSVPVFPDVPQFSEEVTVGTVRLSLTFTYRDRLNGWYLDIHTNTGTAVALGRRLSEGWAPVVGYALDGLDVSQVLVVQGPDEYARADLGTSLMVLVVPVADLPALTGTSPALTLTVVT